MARSKTLLGILLASCFYPVRAYHGDTCCNLAKSEGAFISPPPLANQICGQSYDPRLPPAPDLLVSYKFCSSRCGGMGLSNARIPSQWAAPLVQFILPSVIFSMTIPRRKRIGFEWMFDWRCKWTRFSIVNNGIRLAVSFVLFALQFIPVFVDTILWISIIIVGAGNMIIGGIYEAHLDYRIVKFVAKSKKTNLSPDIKKELLVTLACGNLKRDKHAAIPTIARSITIPGPDSPDDGGERGKSRLLNLLGAQSNFGGAVGSPVLFFLGAFVYTILDLLNDPSSQDAAISLSFGIEWMIIVHVAIVSGCLLAANNPSTSSGIVGSGHTVLDGQEFFKKVSTWSAISRNSDPHPPSTRSQLPTWEKFSQRFLGWRDSYDTKFQPVVLWSRGHTKMEWIKNSAAYQKGFKHHKKFRERMRITWAGWIFKVFTPALILIALPPATGGVVAYFTPPQGLGCRSLSFIVYAGCQIIVTLLATICNAINDGITYPPFHWKRIRKAIFTGRGFCILSAPFWFGSFVAAVGGTTMQVVGVYRNCICYSNAIYWWNLQGINPSVNLASDTANARNSSNNWIVMGSTATVFMAVNCYTGWWYQRLIRRRFVDVVKKMDMQATPGTSPMTSDEHVGDAASLVSGGRASDVGIRPDPVLFAPSSGRRGLLGDLGINTASTSSSQLPEIKISGSTIQEEMELMPSSRRSRLRANS
ncbi:hypothetical protein B0O99DRAFT_143579 [Bisporella sp. PMI_857]|nr:hypothetical protein B0O99DRAFT_143579 [Bisporella sp. PMI_857]